MSDTKELRAVKLTAKQAVALRTVGDADGSTGRYICDLGVSLVTLGRLELNGLVFRGGAIAPMLATWTITPAGRALLSISDARAPSVEEGRHG